MNTTATAGGGGAPSGRVAPTAKWTPPEHTGVVEVDPEQLWQAAGRMTSLRDGFITACHRYAQSLTGTANMAGEDYVGMYFAGLYDPLAREAMQAIGDLMDSVGGAVEGLILSANTYAAADHASTHGASGSPRSVPVPAYGPENFPRPAPATLYGYQDLESWTGNPVETALAQPVTDPIATLQAWLPKGHQDLLITAAAAWRGIASETESLAQGLNAVLTSLTVDTSVERVERGGRFPGKLNNQQVNPWRKAMRLFCDKIWGSAPWGGGGLPAHPLGLAAVCAEKLAAMCDEHRHAIDAARSALETDVTEGVLATVIGALLSEATIGISDLLAEMIDEEKIAEILVLLTKTYYRPIEQIELTWDLLTLRSQLERALRNAPAISYMEAQADSVGSRSLHDFGYPGLKASSPSYPAKDGKGFSTKKYGGWGSPSSMPEYPVDLAGQEGLRGSHVIDKHVGVSDGLLLARFPGEDLSASANGSSSFNNIASAQSLVQGDIDYPANQQEIAAWLAGRKKGTDGRNQLTVNQPVDSSSGTGRVVVEQDGTRRIVEGNGVRAVLRYDASLNPPFYVDTAFPTRS